MDSTWARLTSPYKSLSVLSVAASGGVLPGPYQLLVADFKDRGQRRTQVEVEQAADPQRRCLSVGSERCGQPLVKPAPRPVQLVGVRQAGVDDLAESGCVVLRPVVDLGRCPVHGVGRQLRAVDEVGDRRPQNVVGSLRGQASATWARQDPKLSAVDDAARGLDARHR